MWWWLGKLTLGRATSPPPMSPATSPSAEHHTTTAIAANQSSNNPNSRPNIQMPQNQCGMCMRITDDLKFNRRFARALIAPAAHGCGFTALTLIKFLRCIDLIVCQAYQCSTHGRLELCMANAAWLIVGLGSVASYFRDTSRLGRQNASTVPSVHASHINCAAVFAIWMRLLSWTRLMRSQNISTFALSGRKTPHNATTFTVLLSTKCLR